MNRIFTEILHESYVSLTCNAISKRGKRLPYRKFKCLLLS